MLFNSFAFLVFFPIVVALHWMLPHRFRWLLLLCASYVFYAAWEPTYLLLIVTSTLVDYVAVRGMAASSEPRWRRGFLLLSLFSNLGLLFAFKYFNFFIESAELALQALGVEYSLPVLHVLLPVGISFYTFQTLSYTIDAYRGDKEPETHLGIFALYVSFFPQLVAGPIERSRRLLPQFREVHRWSSRRVAEGLSLMLWGFFKKMVIADRLALYVDSVYAAPAAADGLQVVLATYLFGFQIYCDFSGYSDIGIGAARVLGFRLMDNFRAPYFSRSVREFWSRWHISLSTWFRDYLYIPLGGNRVSRERWCFNILAVFVISGLWHGAAWTFVLWGALHGLYILGERWLRRPHEALPPVVRRLLTFHLVTFAWLFFRAPSLGSAVDMLWAVGDFLASPGIVGWQVSGFGWGEMILALGALLLLEVVQYVTRRQGYLAGLATWPRGVRWAYQIVLLLVLLNFGMFHHPQEFIYFQF